jgi:hypothetical protein
VALPNPLFVRFMDSSHILCVGVREWAQECLCELTRASHSLSTWVCYLYVQGSLPYLWSSTKATHQIWSARSQEELEVVFAGCLAADRQQSDRCLLWSEVRHRSTRWTLSAQVFKDGKLKLVVTPIQPPSRGHQGPFNSTCAGRRNSVTWGDDINKSKAN